MKAELSPVIYDKSDLRARRLKTDIKSQLVIKLSKLIIIKCMEYSLDKPKRHIEPRKKYLRLKIQQQKNKHTYHKHLFYPWIKDKCIHVLLNSQW